MQIVGKVKLKIKTFSCKNNDLEITKLDKEVNDFLEGLALQIEHLSTDNMTKLFQEMQTSVSDTTRVVTVRYIQFIDKEVNFDEVEESEKEEFVPKG